MRISLCQQHLILGLLISLLLPSTVLAEVTVPAPVMAQIEKEYGSAARWRVQQWIALMEQSETITEPEKLQVVNRFFNRLAFVADSKHWGQEDYWATPLEFLASGAGDCEDFAIAKYFTLRAMNVADSHLRLTYVKALRLNQAHMVVSYFGPTQQPKPLVLDNLINEILPAMERKDLVPVYSFNGDGLWLARQRGRGVWVGRSTRLSLWMDLQGRFAKERGNKPAQK